jgi:hypothetical protein
VVTANPLLLIGLPQLKNWNLHYLSLPKSMPPSTRYYFNLLIIFTCLNG